MAFRGFLCQRGVKPSVLCRSNSLPLGWGAYFNLIKLFKYSCALGDRAAILTPGIFTGTVLLYKVLPLLDLMEEIRLSLNRTQPNLIHLIVLGFFLRVTHSTCSCTHYFCLRLSGCVEETWPWENHIVKHAEKSAIKYDFSQPLPRHFGFFTVLICLQSKQIHLKSNFTSLLFFNIL